MDPKQGEFIYVAHIENTWDNPPSIREVEFPASSMQEARRLVDEYIVQHLVPEMRFKALFRLPKAPGTNGSVVD